ncbi:MAG: glycoside hydrolase family 71 [Armatimonadetes bacterium]|nr:glycoside hydrolase family 71 [Armatimonadota bacterium]PIU66227.1 MAG: glycoside hydrolase family 71 [Armatimonadetes bacterium CG07_land_8_20_14_0_80_59_28]
MTNVVLFSLCLSTLGGLQLVPDAKGSPQPKSTAGKRVFAHYMVCCPADGGGATVEDYKREIQAAQERDIDGFALNCGGWTAREPHYKRRALMIYQAAKELGTDFKLLISADYCCGLTLDETRDMIETFRDHPNQFRHDGKPVLSTFSGRKAVTGFIQKEFTGDRAIVFVPFYYPTPAAEMPNQAQVDQVFSNNPSLDGFFHFGAAGTPEQIVASNRLLAAKWLGAEKIFMSPITPFYRGLGGNYRVFECRGFEGMAKQWESAIENNATWVEIVTWNDWGESSYVAPFGPPEKRDVGGGNWGSLPSHVAFLDASRYYIDWFKTGKPPKITQDKFFYFYRLHPKDVPGTVKIGQEQKGRPSHADSLVDDVFVTAFLRSPARLIIDSGGTRQQFQLRRGVHHVSMPFAPGKQRLVVERKGHVLIDKTGEREISATDGWGNFNYFGGAAVAPKRLD